MTDNGLLDDIDIATPVVNYMEDRGGANRRPEYDAFLAMSDAKELWWYQSCMSHGCGDGCVGTNDDYFTGWPSYMIDASAIQNRAMEWLSFSYDIAGELYFETTYDLPTAWDDQCDFSGNGDGTLFYPGTPDRIGGETHIPIESIRLKAIRDGMEDYELLHLLATLGDEDLAKSESGALFPPPTASPRRPPTTSTPRARGSSTAPRSSWASSRRRARTAGCSRARTAACARARTRGRRRAGRGSRTRSVGAGSGCGCRTASGRGSSTAWLAAVLLLLHRRRASRRVAPKGRGVGGGVRSRLRIRSATNRRGIPARPVPRVKAPPVRC